MLVKLVEVKRGIRGNSVTLGEIYVNSSHIECTMKTDKDAQA